MQASNISKLQAETLKLQKEEEEEKLREQQQREQDKKKKKKEEEDEKEQENKRIEQEQREKAEIAIQSANAERIKAEHLQKEQNEKKRLMEEKEAQEQRQLAASISSERERCEAERLQRIDALATQPLPNPDQALDIVDVKKEKKAEVLRLKREAFLKDMNAFSHAIEQEAGKSALGTNGTISDQYSSSVGSSRTGATQQYENLPLPIPLDFTPHEMKKMGVSNSFNDLTSSLFAANSASDAVGNGTDIWGESSEVPHINRAANVTVNPSGSGRQKRELAVSEYSDRRNGRGGISEFEEEEEEDEGMGGAASISNILTKDERMVLSTQQKVAWKALQADLTTRRKGDYYMCCNNGCNQ